MTPSEAVDLQSAWKLRRPQCNCFHRDVELEMTETGRYLTGNYHCIVCGERVGKKKV